MGYVTGKTIKELREKRENGNQSANMRKMCFYVCPVCGNIITSVGHCVIYAYCNRHGMFKTIV